MASLGVVGLLVGTLTLGSSSPIGGAAEDNRAGAAASSTVPRPTRDVASGATAVGGALNGGPTSPDETARMSFATISTASPTPDTVLGPAAATGAGTLTPALVLAGSALLLLGGVALLLVPRRREPIPNR
jgi:LPXTG-motif cell wall-anchored protein